MSDFIGMRISLISKSDIRYVGTLHEINSDDSTVSLENVKSYGTEGRRGGGEDEAPPSDQIYEYIIFRGKDVKDLRVEERSPNPPPPPPAVPDDPAILNARTRPNNLPPGPPNQQGPPGGPGAPGFGYYPPPPGGWGRGGPPPPMSGFNGMQYPPQPPPGGWYPPGQGFPPGPPGPGPWGNYPQPFPPGAGAPSGALGPHNRQAPAQESRPAPVGATSDKKPSTPVQQGNVPAQSKPAGQLPPQSVAAARGPPPPVDSKPTVEQVKATAASLTAGAPSVPGGEATKANPTGPKNNRRPTQILPAVPLPAALTAKVTQPAPAASVNLSTDVQAALQDATQAARAAVALAMAKSTAPAGSQQATEATVDSLANKVSEMRVNNHRGDASRGTHHTRGGRGRGPRATKVEVPDADFDFASSNAKFNKEEIVKEAIATGSPLGEGTPNGAEAAPEAVLETAPGYGAPPAYNKQKSFFDNISSEAKDRAESAQKPGGRERRGEAHRKDIETFGQGSVDGGYRGNYRGRGRGRGGRGRGYGRGGAGRGGASYRANSESQTMS